MLKYATTIAPLLLKLGAQRPAKALRNYVGGVLLSGLIVMFFLAAFFTWVASTYGLDIAFLTIALILCVLAIGLKIKERVSERTALKAAKDRDSQIKGMLAAKEDPLAEYISDDILAHPAVQKVLGQIEDKPVLSMLVALVLGIILSQQFLDDAE